jgi:carboxyl-terminal processing protease
MEDADSIAFADTIKYYTPAGKVVYGGGGIMPDVYVPLKADPNDRLYNQMVHQNIIFEYAFDYTDRERSSLREYASADDFISRYRISDALYNGLLAFAREKGLEFSSAEARDSEYKIRVLLKAYIGRNLLDDAAFYPVYHEVDKVFMAGMDAIEPTGKPVDSE